VYITVESVPGTNQY